MTRTTFIDRTKTKTEIPMKWSSTNDLSLRIAQPSCYCEISNKLFLLFSIHSMLFARNVCERQTCNYTISKRYLFGHTHNFVESNGFVSADREWIGRCMFESCTKSAMKLKTTAVSVSCGDHTLDLFGLNWNGTPASIKQHVADR